MTEPPVVLLDRKGTAARLHASQSTVRRYEHLGLLDARKVGPRLVRITEASVEALLSKRKDAA